MMQGSVRRVEGPSTYSGIGNSIHRGSLAQNAFIWIVTKIIIDLAI